MKAPNDPKSAPARALEEGPKPDGYCHNCGVEVRPEESFCCEYCRTDYRKFRPRKP